MDYLGGILAFLAALAAIRGDTWNANATGLFRISSTGWIAALCALGGVLVSAFSITETNAEKRKLDQDIIAIQKQNSALLELSQTNKNTQASILQNNELLLTQNSDLLEMNSFLQIEVSELRGDTKTINAVARRIDHTFMTRGVRLSEPGSIWRSENPISTGSVLTFRNFNCSIQVSIGEINRRFSGSQKHEIEVAGPSGAVYPLLIRRTSAQGLVRNTVDQQACFGKVRGSQSLVSASSDDSTPIEE